MSETQQCRTEDGKCKCVNTCPCGTGDTGCTEPPMNHMSSSMCNGVFAPVCAPEICNVPRIPHHEILVKGQDVLLDMGGPQKIYFNILVEREMQVYRGNLELKDLKCDGISIKADGLKFFESDGMARMQVIFHEKSTGRNIMVTVYKGKKEDEGKEEHQKHQGHEQELTQVFIYSASSEADLINLSGKVVSGKIELYADHNVHGH